jgi:uncharacterized repeat protein (TIGR04076 family)
LQVVEKIWQIKNSMVLPGEVREMKPKKVRITVLRISYNKDFVEEYTEGVEWQPCSILKEGEEFISDGWMPEGFCNFAWADIHKYVLVLARGGNMLGVKPGTFITCCTDGFRPVFFKLERIDETEGGHENETG